MAMATTHLWPPRPEYQPSTLSVICSGKLGWVFPPPCFWFSFPPLASCRKSSIFPLHLLCPHRLSSRSSPPAGTLPKTRKLGRRSLSTTATRWMQTTPKRSIRHILIKREWKHIQSVVLLPITVTCKCGQHGCIVAWIRTSIWDGVHLFFPPAGLRWSYSLH